MALGIIDSLNAISRTMDSILDFLAADEELSSDFQKYLEINNIEIESEKQFNNVVVEYILDMKTQSGLRVLEYYRRNNKSHDEIINALLASFSGVFKVNKIISNGYETTCITSDKEITLTSMVKMSNLKQIGKYDYIKARIVELGGVQYILEILDVISEHDVYGATVEGIKYLIQDSRCAYYKNPQMKEKLIKSAGEFWEKFHFCFNTNKDYIITTNKKIDDLIEYFNKFRLSEKVSGFENLIQKVDENKYIKIEELNCSDEKFIQNAIGGFSSHKEIYDIALWVDKNRGLYIIPFLETFFKCFESDIEGKNECLREFLTSDKIPPGVIKYAHDKYKNFFEEINKVLGVKFSTLEELLFNTKSCYIENEMFSPVTVLFNSELFSSMIEYNN